MWRRCLSAFPLILSFLLPLLCYWYGLAPAVTFEDSGELITAAYHFGVPHPPGYPLYTLLAGLWLKLSWVEPARALNFFSAFLSSLASLVLFLTGRRLNDSLLSLDERFAKWISLMAAVAVSLAPHYFRQSVIVEVYALNNLICALLLFAVIGLDKNAKNFKRRILLAAFLLGLAVSAHQTSLVFVPAVFSAVLFADRHYWMSLKNWLKTGGAFFLGLLPYAYIPIRAAADPVLNWGNADTPVNFWRLISRHQYHPQLMRSGSLLIEQLREQVILLVNQFPFAFLFLGLWALILLFKARRSLFWLLFILVLVTGPLVAVLANFHFPIQHVDAYLDLAHIHSVFYLPHYQVWGLLFGLGLGYLFFLASTWRYRQLAGLFLVLAVAFRLAAYGFQTVKTESKKDYRFPQEYFANLEVLSAGQPSLVLVNWDPFSFPSFYYQRVLHQGKNMMFVDLELFKAEWYLSDLRQRYPGFEALQSEAVKALQVQRKKFLEKENSYDEKEFFKAYVDSSNAIIQYAKDRGWRVFLVIYRRFSGLLPGVAQGYFLEPRLVAAELRAPGEQLPPLPPLESFTLPDFHPSRFRHDRLARMLNFYYSEIFIETAEKWFQDKQSDKAIDILNVVKKWNAEDPRLKERAARALRQIEKNGTGKSGD